MVNPASLDLCFSGRVCLPRPDWNNPRYVNQWAGKLRENPQSWQEMKTKMWGEVQEVETMVLMPGSFMLTDTPERFVFPENLAGQILLKSSWARVGLNHALAGWFDPGRPGFVGTATLEFFNVAPWPVLLTKGQPLVQMIFHECYPPAVGYDVKGNYNGQYEPTKSK